MLQNRLRIVTVEQEKLVLGGEVSVLKQYKLSF
jgi:hypothetical protein